KSHRGLRAGNHPHALHGGDNNAARFMASGCQLLLKGNEFAGIQPKKHIVEVRLKRRLLSESGDRQKCNGRERTKECLDGFHMGFSPVRSKHTTEPFSVNKHAIAIAEKS